MKQFFMAIAAVLFASTFAQSTPAEAGKNVKLQFGGPLGAFKAKGNGRKSAHKCGHSCRAALKRKKAAARKRAIAKRKAAERRKAIAAHKAAEKKKAIAARKAAQKRKAIAAAKKRKKAQELARAKEEKKKAAEAETAKASEDTEAEEKNVAKDDGAGETDKDSVNVSALAAIGKPLDQVVKTDKAKKSNEEGNASTIETGATELVDESIAAADSCKKFIPSAGMTITVPCDAE